jgi:carbon storage regulator
MLILSRKVGERVVIGDSIVVTVVHLKRGRVRLGIDAPADVTVLREEVRRRVRPRAATAVRLAAHN